jgi:putative hemolysin
MCSRKQRGKVCDLPWKSGFIKRAVASKRDIIPVYVDGGLSRRFYGLARLRKALGIKQNIEMILLPSELFAQRGRHFRIVFGSPIAWEILASEQSAEASTLLVRDEMERLRAYYR